MAQQRVVVHGVRELRRDLKRVDKTLPRELNKRIKVALKPVLVDAKQHATVRRGRIARTLRLGTRGSAVFIGSSHPAANIVHWGGRHPVFGNREVWAVQKPRPFIKWALEGRGDDIERKVGDVVEDLMRDAGFK